MVYIARVIRLPYTHVYHMYTCNALSNTSSQTIPRFDTSMTLLSRSTCIETFTFVNNEYIFLGSIVLCKGKVGEIYKHNGN